MRMRMTILWTTLKMRQMIRKLLKKLQHLSSRRQNRRQLSLSLKKMRNRKSKRSSTMMTMSRSRIRIKRAITM